MTSHLPWGWQRQPCRHKSLYTWTSRKESGWMAPAPLAWSAPACPSLLSLHCFPPGWFFDKFIAVFTRKRSVESCFWRNKCRLTVPQGFRGWKAAEEALEALHRGTHVYTYVKRTIVWGKQVVLETLGIAEWFCKNSKKQIGKKRQPIFIECIQCNRLSIKTFQAIVSGNP